MNNFSQWIDRKFVEWQAKQGKRKTIEEFAIYIGVSRPLLTMWMNGNKKPGKENTELLAQIFGNDVYDALGKERPNPYLQAIVNNFEFISEDLQERIARQIAEEAAKYEAQKKTDKVRPAPKRNKA